MYFIWIDDRKKNGVAIRDTKKPTEYDRGRPPKFMGDKKLQKEFDKAWEESNPDGKFDDKLEQGGWVVRDKDGNLSLIRVEPEGPKSISVRNFIKVKPKKDSGLTVVGWFHTHPATKQEGGDPWPSNPDWHFTEWRAHVPGVVKSHDGYWYMNPGRR